VRYFSEESQADKAVSEDVTQVALRLAGAWSDLSWEEMERELDRIRHESKPTPPFELGNVIYLIRHLSQHIFKSESL
jgi:hypothetical protein